MKIDTREITLAATLTALCAITGLLPFVFFLPVAIAATTLSLGVTAFVGLAFGCISLTYSFMLPVPSLVAIGFMQAPYIAIFPRLFSAVGAFFVYALVRRFLKPTKKVRRIAAVAVAAATASLLNTALVVSMFVLIMPTLSMGGVTMIAASAEMLVSGVIECVCVAALTPPISLTLDRVVLKKTCKLAIARQDKQ